MLCLSLSACTVGPDYHRPDVQVQDGWASQVDKLVPVDSKEAQSGEWWEQFSDPVLIQLLALGRENSPTLQSTAVHIAEAQAQMGVSEAASWPDIGLGYGRTDSKSNAPAQSGVQTISTQQLALQASWEPDFWGAASRGFESSKASWMSSIAAYQAALVALDAHIANAYFNVRTLEQRIRVAQDNLVQQAENLRIAEARFKAGATSEQDYRQAEVQYQQTLAGVPGLQTAMAQGQHALSVLLGQTPDYYQKHFSGEYTMPRRPAGVPGGMPHDLLKRRPDVRQAEYAAIAQSAQIGQAKAALYPTFSLNGTFGYQSNSQGSNNLNSMFQWGNIFQNLSGGILLPIFNHGKLVNQVRVKDAQFEQALLSYQNQVLKAQQEVEDALASITGGTAQSQSLQLARIAAHQSTALALMRYKSGETDFTTVTSAYQSQLQAEDSLAQVEGALLQAYVAVYLALGGGWDGSLHAELSPTVSEQMNERTDWGQMLQLPNRQDPAQ